MEQDTIEQAAKDAVSKDKTLRIQIDQCKRDLEALKSGMRAAEEVVADGNKDLGKYLFER